MDINKIPAYEVIRQEDLGDIHSKGTLLHHKKTGAHVMVIENDDDNKVFQIAFRTPPTDSTGVAHILEHSVLCGSKSFPLKDPFVELVKGSMNTFLNAMTFPDRTTYPVASCNDKDFQNLMHVYLDAVFYPNIYQKEKIFRQEGWNYHLEDVNGPLTYNGVVYNEMKGAFSSSDDILEREIMNRLFPDTAYGVESGGDPDHIPDLTYEQFLEFHRTYYHPSNSYIYLYGDADMAEKLDFIDREYLSHFDRICVNSAVELQKPFEAFREYEEVYPIAETDQMEDNTYLSYNLVIDDRTDPYLNEAFAVLDYALLSSPGAPIRLALLEAGIGSDIDGAFEDAFLQSYFSVVAHGANLEQKEEFISVIRSTLEKVVREGVDEKAILAGLGAQEFRFREADYYSYPKGLMYGLGILGDWIYDEDAAFNQVKVLGVYDYLKKQVGTGYFEGLIQKALLDNPHGCVVVLKPQRGLTTQKEEALSEKLSSYLSSLSLPQREELVRRTQELIAYQEAEDTKEAIATLPKLTREDLPRKARPFINEPLDVEGTTLLYHEVDTNGIGYVDLLFEIKDFSNEDIHYLGLLKAVLGYIDTQLHTYGELYNEINASTGGLSFGVETFEKMGDAQAFLAKFGVKGKALYADLPKLMEFCRECIQLSRLEDTKRLGEIVAEVQSRMQASLASSGHGTAVMRGFSYSSPLSLFQDEMTGIGFYRFITELNKDFASCAEKISSGLKNLCDRLFVREGLFVSYTAEREGLDAFQEQLRGFLKALPAAKQEPARPLMKCEKKNEGFSASVQVQYVARCGNFLKKGFAYTGLLEILRVILSYEYLWVNIRVKGGAYGCMSGFRRSGEGYFVSYRDPHLHRTLEVFDGIPAYLENFTVDEDTMNRYIIGAVSAKMSPLTPQMMGTRGKLGYLSGLTFEDSQRELEEILSATQEQIRGLAPLVQAILDADQVCVVGSESALKGAGDVLQTVVPLN